MIYIIKADLKQLKHYLLFEELKQKRGPATKSHRANTSTGILAMDEQTIRVLETTFTEFARGKEESAALFYERLFALDPSLRRLFVNTEMKHQQTKLMAALGLVVGSLRDLGRVVPVLVLSHTMPPS